MSSMFAYKPREEDYRIWQVLDPAKFIVPIWVTALVIALVVHSYVLTSAKYNFLATPAKAALVK